MWTLPRPLPPRLLLLQDHPKPALAELLPLLALHLSLLLPNLWLSLTPTLPAPRFLLLENILWALLPSPAPRLRKPSSNLPRPLSPRLRSSWTRLLRWPRPISSTPQAPPSLPLSCWSTLRPPPPPLRPPG